MNELVVSGELLSCGYSRRRPALVVAIPSDEARGDTEGVDILPL